MRAPDVQGGAGRAWCIPNRSTHPDHAAGLISYLLDVPGAHPFWHRWALSVIHLRPIHNVRPAVIRLPGATHEIIIASIDPKWAPVEDMDDLGFSRGVPYLRPIDVMHQFIVRGDVDAVQLGTLCARAVCDGILSPDQDHRSAWVASIDATAAHLRQGRHDVS